MGLLDKLRQLGGESKPKEIDFSNVIGHDNAKSILKMAVEAVKPVHVLMSGTYGIAKTELMLDVEKYIGKKNSHFSIGSRISKAGIGDLLFREKDLEWLFIDELETMSRKDQAVLLSVMQHGIVTETLYKKMRETKVNVRIMATTNDPRPSKVLPALLTRFYPVYMNAYTEEEFVNIAISLLSNRAGIDRDKAILISKVIYNKAYQPNPRMVAQVADLSQGDDDKIYMAISGLIKPEVKEKK